MKKTITKGIILGITGLVFMFALVGCKGPKDFANCPKDLCSIAREKATELGHKKLIEVQKECYSCTIMSATKRRHNSEFYYTYFTQTTDKFTFEEREND